MIIVLVALERNISFAVEKEYKKINKIQIKIDMPTSQMYLMQNDYDKCDKMGSKSPICRLKRK